MGSFLLQKICTKKTCYNNSKSVYIFYYDRKENKKKKRENQMLENLETTNIDFILKLACMGSLLVVGKDTKYNYDIINRIINAAKPKKIGICCGNNKMLKSENDKFAFFDTFSDAKNKINSCDFLFVDNINNSQMEYIKKSMTQSSKKVIASVWSDSIEKDVTKELIDSFSSIIYVENKQMYICKQNPVVFIL